MSRPSYLMRSENLGRNGRFIRFNNICSEGLTKLIKLFINKGVLMKVTEINGVKIYDLNTAKTLSHYINEAKAKKTKLTKLKNYESQIELIADFEFKN